MRAVHNVNLLSSFDNVSIINMLSRKDRREETEAEFKRNNFEIDGEKVSFFEAVTPSEAAGFPSKGTRGCFLSHLGVLKAALDEGVSSKLVLEDDICFTKELKNIQGDVVKELSNLDWDFVYLGHALESEEPRQFKRVSQPMLLSHCYAINAKCMEKLVDYLELVLTREPGHPEGGPMHYDGALNMFFAANPDFNVYYYSENLAYQRPSATNIHEHSKLEQMFFLGPLIRFYRSVKGLLLRQLK